MDCFSMLDQLAFPMQLLAQATVTDKVPTPAWQLWIYNIMFVLAIFVLPFVLSTFISKAIRLPAISTRLGTMLAVIIGSLLFAYNADFKMKLGPDMKGGTNLIYNIKQPTDGSPKPDASALASALSSRLNPSGTNEMSIRPYGESQIEIIVPNSDEFELAEIKRRIVSAGALQFRIVANSRDHGDLIEFARQQAQSPDRERATVANAAGKVVGRWYTVGRDKELPTGIRPLKTPVLGDIIRNSRTGEMIVNPPLQMSEEYALENWMKRQDIPDVDVLMALEANGEPYVEVSGDDLASAAMEFDSKTGEPTVGFKLTTEGSGKMLRMTVRNVPDGNFHRRMAIILDDKVLSAPQLNGSISSNGQITGNFTQAEVKFLVEILREGRLPATLEETVASENRVGAGLGEATISRGMYASAISMIITFACILVYYRFAGVIAVIALIINGLMIFGSMIFLSQPLTLAGLAGLVLTVGMSVDANVLIYERIREEVAKGSAKRMAVRNGFDRALTTIIDSNLTTLIAAIVLYWIGTDQVRGFAVALIIGISTSMFTATFCSRLMFDIAEKFGLVNLSMWDGIEFIKRNVIGAGDVDFMGKQKACLIFSGALIALGLLAVAIRGKDILNIDFTGGTSVTFQTSQPIKADELRALTRKILEKDARGEYIQSTLVSVEKQPEDSVYTLVTSLKSRDELEQLLVEGFAKEKAGFVTYSLKVLPSNSTSQNDHRPAGLNPAGQNSEIHRSNNRSAVRLVSFQDDPKPAEASSPEASPAVAEVTSLPQEPAATQPPTTPSTEGATATGTQTPEQATGTEATPGTAAAAAPSASTILMLQFQSSNENAASESDKIARISAPDLKKKVIAAAAANNLNLTNAAFRVEPNPMPKDWNEESLSGHGQWKVTLPFDNAQAKAIVGTLDSTLAKQPLWLSLSNIGERVAGQMQQRAIGAVLLSLVFIMAYIWFRFQKVAFGVAAVVALLHDVVITLGIMALCHWLVGPLQFLMIEDFKIGLTEVAAFLTIIGYSLNDTIVVFDRIREVRGKSPKLTSKMINDSVNQTLSRTLLTSGTTILTLVILYIWGGEGIHAFAFALLFGIITGTYSSIFVAAPVLLWLANRETPSNQRGVISN
jgi:SecD/SecF fusion protein